MIFPFLGGASYCGTDGNGKCKDNCGVEEVSNRDSTWIQVDCDFST